MEAVYGQGIPLPLTACGKYDEENPEFEDLAGELSMAQLTLEQRVAALERQVAELTGQSDGTEEKGWRQTVGMFTDDLGMQELFAEAMRIREADRKKAHRRSKRRKAKS